MTLHRCKRYTNSITLYSTFVPVGFVLSVSTLKRLCVIHRPHVWITSDYQNKLHLSSKTALIDLFFFVIETALFCVIGT